MDFVSFPLARARGARGSRVARGRGGAGRRASGGGAEGRRKQRRRPGFSDVVLMSLPMSTTDVLRHVKDCEVRRSLCVYFDDMVKVAGGRRGRRGRFLGFRGPRRGGGRERRFRWRRRRRRVVGRTPETAGTTGPPWTPARRAAGLPLGRGERTSLRGRAAAGGARTCAGRGLPRPGFDRPGVLGVRVSYTHVSGTAKSC